MRSHRVDAITPYLAPASESWARLDQTRIALVPTPLPMQPTAYVRSSWAGREFGQTPAVDVSTAHDGKTWAVRIGWKTAKSRPDAEFPEAVAVALPISPDAVFALMGSPEAPIHYLRWDSHSPGARSIVAGGIGSSAPGPDVRQAAQSAIDGDTWRVVIVRALGESRNGAALTPGSRTGIGFAVWRGANDERAGIKAFSGNWIELELDG